MSLKPNRTNLKTNPLSINKYLLSSRRIFLKSEILKNPNRLK